MTASDNIAPLVRPARWADVNAMVTLIERRRDEYQVIAPTFWKKSANSAVWTRRYYRFLLLMRRATMLIAESDSAIVGFLIAIKARVPPVFDPGPTVFIDDFYVADPAQWDSVGGALIDRLRVEADKHGWRQVIAVSGTEDRAKNAFLGSVGLVETSSWWTQPL